MAATRENVLAAIVSYVEENKRRAPASAIALTVGDTLPNVQAIIKTLVTEGSINSSRGRNGGALPDGVTLPKKDKPAKTEKAASEEKADVQEGEAVQDQNDSAAELAALLASLEAAPADEPAPVDLFADA